MARLLLLLLLLLLCFILATCLRFLLYLSVNNYFCLATCWVVISWLYLKAAREWRWSRSLYKYIFSAELFRYRILQLFRVAFCLFILVVRESKPKEKHSIRWAKWCVVNTREAENWRKETARRLVPFVIRRFATDSSFIYIIFFVNLPIFSSTHQLVLLLHYSSFRWGFFPHFPHFCNLL